MLHQCEGVCSSLDSSQEVQVAEGNIYKTSHSHHDNCVLSKQGGLNEVSFPLILDPVDSSFSGVDGLDPDGGTYKRKSERLTCFLETFQCQQNGH